MGLLELFGLEGIFEGRKTFRDAKGYWRYADTQRLVHRDIAYRKIFLPNRNQYQHQFHYYVIHHKDGNKRNNDPKNLQILTWKEHGKVHSGCFIATAAYGTSSAGEIDILREFRDKKLETNRLGNLLVNFYYAISPPIAEFISKSEWLKAFVRLTLKPIIKMLGLIDYE